MQTNIRRKPGPVTTHEGAPAGHINPKDALRRSVMSCLLWEDTFYESGEEIGARTGRLVREVPAEFARDLAIEAREVMHLRHVPLWIAVNLAPRGAEAKLSALLERIIKRADEPGEFLSLYWRDKRKPISAQIKRGLDEDHFADPPWAVRRGLHETFVWLARTGETDC